MSCKLSAIVAVSDDWGIGYDGDMIVSNKADMRRFVELTTGHTVIMGRRTLDSFPGGRPLKNRRNIVLTRDASFEREGVEVVHSVDEALDAIADEPNLFLLAGHMSLQKDKWPTVVTGLGAVHPQTPIFIVGGHSLIRDCGELLIAA